MTNVASTLAGALLAVARAGAARAVPAVRRERFYTELVTKMMILAIFALSLDLLVGYTGLVSLRPRGVLRRRRLHARPAGAEVRGGEPVADAAGGDAVAAASRRWSIGAARRAQLKGIYFIMVTLAFAQMFYFVFHDTQVRPRLRRHQHELSSRSRRSAASRRSTSAKPTHVYYFVLALLVAVFVFLRVRAALAVRPRAAGHPQQRAPDALARLPDLPLQARELHARRRARRARRLSVGGAVRLRQPGACRWHQSGNVLLMLILGGMGTPVRRRSSARSRSSRCRRSSQSLTKHWQLLLGGAIILLVIFLPGARERRGASRAR